MKQVGLILLTALTLSACTASAALNDGAEAIRIQNTVPSDAEVEMLGEVSCSFGYNAMPPNQNVKSCRNDMRNQAQALGAEFLVIENQQIGDTNCRNCVTMFGTAYKYSQTD